MEVRLSALPSRDEDDQPVGKRRRPEGLTKELNVDVEIICCEW